jgi:hypothetical protein
MLAPKPLSAISQRVATLEAIDVAYDELVVSLLENRVDRRMAPARRCETLFWRFVDGPLAAEPTLLYESSSCAARRAVGKRSLMLVRSAISASATACRS